MIDHETMMGIVATESIGGATEPLPSVPNSPFFSQCPACGSRNIYHWEKTTDGKVHGGKDCRDCGAMSRRWIGEGNGRGIWTCGPGIHEGMTVAEATTVMDSDNLQPFAL